ncbi:copper homeostasis membrane protein CopD [Cupriavidus campinensis]
MDWLNVLVRVALYLDLMLMFGLPLFALCVLRADERGAALAVRLVRCTAVAGVAGILLSVAGMAIMAKAMTGAATYAELSQHVLEMMVIGTDFGAAWVGRLAALLAGVACAMALQRRPALLFAALALCGAIALSTLAWAGHGAMDDGTRRVVHLSVDIVHLLAAGAWLGALAALGLLGAAAHAEPLGMARLARAAQGFAHMGTAIVVTLTVTGAVNYWLIAGAPTRAAADSPYGRLLMLKLALFALMLGAAALNRYRLSPALAAASGPESQRTAVAAFRKSLRFEAAMALAVLVAVAVLGLLSPDMQDRPAPGPREPGTLTQAGFTSIIRQ